MFNIEPDRPAQPGPRPSTRRMPLADPPAKPRTWWGTLPGQAAILAMLAGAVVIALGLAGVIGPLAAR